MKLLNPAWGIVERCGFWEARADFVDETRQIHNECYAFETEPTLANIDIKIAASIVRLTDEVIALPPLVTPEKKLNVAIEEYLAVTGETAESVATLVLGRVSMERKYAYLSGGATEAAVALDAKNAPIDDGLDVANIIAGGL